ncbi:unnamed protein product [Notodromas monacha]|uniref:JmjC domain-containing protein 5 n=1 Tax=Notodromas monacha TaxID=399045 RepID=A0A7R9BIH6_9CRUS|nr:unnamed protein product [Notodromas monacha]CAG0915835.1 unnamed protein product [Notodromas monacha]
MMDIQELRVALPSHKDLVRLATQFSPILHPGFEEMLVFVIEELFEDRFSAEVQEKSAALVDYIWERLNMGHWADIPSDLRRCYSLSSLGKIVTSARNKDWKSALRACDMALMMGAPFNEENLLGNLADKICASLTENISFEAFVKDSRTPFPEVESFRKDFMLLEELQRLECPSIETFVRDFVVPGKPVVIEKAVEHWTAREWSLQRLLKLAGKRLIPVELGSKYTDEDWSQGLMLFEDFVSKYVVPENPEQVAYLAQFDLFAHVPCLRDDFMVPDYCLQEPEKVDINAWFGPKNTVSPLHTDPRGNCFVQVLGSKYVRLYCKEETPRLYAHDEGLLSNTSRVTDAENPDLVEFPDFKLAAGYDCVLGPGDLLYIPPGCWHYVKSLSTYLLPSDDAIITSFFGILDVILPPADACNSGKKTLFV